MQPVVVYDTNILFSSILWRSKPNHCIELARQNIVTGLTCQEIIEELVEIRTKAKFSSFGYHRRTPQFLRLVKITNTLKVVEVDPDDDKVIECAVVGSATHIITGDRRHLLPLGNYQGILIITAADFLRQVL